MDASTRVTPFVPAAAQRPTRPPKAGFSSQAAHSKKSPFTRHDASRTQEVLSDSPSTLTAFLTADAVRNYVEDFRPIVVLAGVDWELAEDAVKAGVLRTAPGTANQAHDLLAALGPFLAGPCGWDRVSAPDLAALLTDASIRRFAAGQITPAVKGRVRAMLLRLQRAQIGLIGPLDKSGRKGRYQHTKPNREVGSVYATCTGYSFVAFSTTCAVYTKRPTTEIRLRGLVSWLLANVPEVPAGTVPLDGDTLETYLGAHNAELSEELVRTQGATKSTKKPARHSERHAQAQLRADRAAHRRATQGPLLAPPPEDSALIPTVLDALERYRPQELQEETWAALRPLVRRLVLGYRPPSVVSARNVATIVVGFLQWVWSLQDRSDPSVPPSPEELLASPLHEAYIRRRVVAGLSVPATSASTERSVLRRCLLALDADQLTPVINHAPVAPPYTPQECDTFVMVALSQPTVGRQRNTCYLIGLALGAGLAPGDFRLVRRSDIVERQAEDGTTYLAVQLAGRSPRTVPIRSAYEPLVLRALELSRDLDPQALVIGQKTDRHQPTDAVRRQVVTARGSIDIDARRLRTTWLFAMMNARIPLPQLLQLAGLRSARTLVDLLDLCPGGSLQDVADSLTALREAPNAAPTQERQL